jgi:hypothetical protein
MVDEKHAREDLEDIDGRLKEASAVLVAEMERLIRRAKILQLEHKAIVEERRKNKGFGKG